MTESNEARATAALARALAGGDALEAAANGKMAEAAWARAVMADWGCDVAALPPGDPRLGERPDAGRVEALAAGLADYRRRAKEPTPRERADAEAAAALLAALGAALVAVKRAAA